MSEHLWLTSRADYAVRALVALARARGPLTNDAIAEAQGLPAAFLAVIMGQLRRAGLVTSHRGRTGGYELARSPDVITMADVVRAVDGDLEDGAVSEAGVPGETTLGEVYRTLRRSLLGVLDAVSVGGLVRGHVPAHVRRLAEARAAGTEPVRRTPTRRSRPGR